MHILLISSELPPDTGSGGIGTYVTHVAPALVAAGHRVSVLAGSATGVDTDELSPAGVRIVRVATRQAPPGFWSAPFDGGLARWATEHYDRAYTVAIALQEVPGLADADVIEAADWGGEAALLPLVTNAPHTIRFHTPARLVFEWNASGAPQRFVDALHALERIAVESAAGYTCPSVWMVPAVEDVFAMPGGFVRTIANPFTPDIGCLAMLDRPRAQSVLYLGRLETRKGVLDVIPAMITVMGAMPDVRWRLAGADVVDGLEGGSVRAAIIDAFPPELRGRLDFLGHLDRARVSHELATAGAVLLPSRRENFPYTCLEALAAGAPVVAGRHGGMAEMIEDSVTGILVDPLNPDDVAHGLFRVLAQPLFAAQLGRAALRGLPGRFAPDIVADELVAHYESVIGSKVAA